MKHIIALHLKKGIIDGKEHARLAYFVRNFKYFSKTCINFAQCILQKPATEVQGFIL